MLSINLKEEHVFVCMSRCMCVWGSVINGAQREERKNKFPGLPALYRKMNTLSGQHKYI